MCQFLNSNIEDNLTADILRRKLNAPRLNEVDITFRKVCASVFTQHFIFEWRP